MRDVLRVAVLFVLVLTAAAPAHAAFPGENGKIVYDDSGSIWAADGPKSKPARFDWRIPGFESGAVGRTYISASRPEVSADGENAVVTVKAGRRVRPGPGGFEEEQFLGQMKLDGSVQTRLLDWPNEAELGGGTFSPDGQRIAFDAYGSRNDSWLSGATVYLMTSDGTNVERLTGGFDPTFSPDGDAIAFSRQDGDTRFDLGIYSIGLDGTEERRIASGSNPDFSPDGELIVFEGHAPTDDPECEPSPTVSVMNSDGTGVRHLRTGYSCLDGFRGFSSPSFSPNGHKVVFALYDAGGLIRPFQYVSVVDVDGTNEQVAFRARDAFSPSLGEVDWGPEADGAHAESCGRQRATIVGTELADVIIGTNGADVIQGRGGDDVIGGRDGRDLICGGSGDDRVKGGKKGDRLIGGPDNDLLRGNGGRDALIGGKGFDHCVGGKGVDTMRCESSRPG